MRIATPAKSRHRLCCSSTSAAIWITGIRRWSTRTTPGTVREMAIDAIAFLDAMEFAQVDVLGFSIGSFVAQEIALIRSGVVRRLVLASSAPRGAAGMHGWASDVIAAVGAPAPNPDGYLEVFFTRSNASRQSGVKALGRMTARSEDRDKPTTWQTRQAQYDAVCAWGIPDHGLLQRVSAIDMPVFVANGDGDPMILPAHGFLFQHHAESAGDVEAFLGAR
jgi:pimeloyl-ACP methyl ester carboxylesterase